MTFTPDELAQTILAAQRRPEETPNSITTREVAEALRVSMTTAARLVRAAFAAGVLRPEWVVRVTPHGVARRYEGWVLVERPAAS